MSEFFKKVFAVFIAVFTAISSFITGSINIQKHDLAIKLDSNPSTGYSWVVELDKEGVIKESGSHYADRPHIGNLAGAGGTETFYFDAVSDGKVNITLTYGRHWEGGDIARTIVYECLCENGSIKVLSVKDSAEEQAA